MNSQINYPPEEVIKPSYTRPNFELIILWMLNNNLSCTWGDLQEKISKSTLQIYLKKLIKKGYIKKEGYNQYVITPKGGDRYYELSEFKKKKRILNYPPRIIIEKQRNYDHWILWMLYNNNYCIWSDFLQDPLSINQSSLSKNMNSLLEKGYIKKDGKKYIITQSGKLEYSRILKRYDLDKQSILEEESKRIKDLTEETIKFFEKFDIDDKKIKFRYLNNKLKLPFEIIKPALDNEEDFNKVLLFLSMNHPDEFPNYIAPEEFAQKYNINLIKLKFIIIRIVEESLYPIEFFKLEVEPEKYYYFQVNEKLEKMLNTIVESHITEFTYLYNLYEQSSNHMTPFSMDVIIDEILEDICGSLFNIEFSDSLKTFLPDYIDYLAYKVEKEKKFIDIYDKLEGLIWKNILELSQIERSGNLKYQSKEEIKTIDKKIKANPKNIDLYYSKISILMYYDQFDEILDILNQMLKIFPEKDKDIKMKQASVLKKLRKVDEGLQIINELIDKYPDDPDLYSYKAYWYQYLDRKDDAIKIMQNLIKDNPRRIIYHDTYGEILMNFKEYEGAIKEFKTVLQKESKGWFIYQTYLKLGICYKELEKYDLAIEALNKGKELSNKGTEDLENKQKWISIANLFLTEIEYIK